MNPDSDLVRWYEALCLISSSRPQTPVDAIVVHARSHGRDGDGLLETAAQFVKSGMARHIVINGGDGESFTPGGPKAWPGKDEYLAALDSFGIKNVILSMPAKATHEEAEMFALEIKKRGWMKVAVLNHVHCLPRAMCTWLKVLMRNELSTELYPVAPTSLPWSVKVHGQQGSEPDQRIMQCRGELKRFYDYQEKWPHNFVPLDILIGYLLQINMN